MVMPNRTYASGGTKYRYGMNGQEHEDEVFEGATSAEYWMYDSRLGRRFENDPITHNWESPYVCFSNNPILLDDANGLADKTKMKRGPKGKRKKSSFTQKRGKYTGFKRKEGGNTNKLGKAYMKTVGFLRKLFTGAKYALSLVPQGTWNTCFTTCYMFAAPGGFDQWDFRTNLQNSAGGFMQRLVGITGFIDNADAFFDILQGKVVNGGPIGGYARLTGMRGGAGNRVWKGISMNTGLRGFMQSRSDYDYGAIDVGSEFLPGLNFIDDILGLIRALPGKLGITGKKYSGPVMMAEIVNKAIMNPAFRGITSLRLENASFTKHNVEAFLLVRY